MAAQRPVLKSNVAHRWSCVVERRGGSLRSALSKCNLEQGLQTLRPLRHFTFRLSIRRSSHRSRRRRSTAATIRHQIINTSCRPPPSPPPPLCHPELWESCESVAQHYLCRFLWNKSFQLKLSQTLPSTHQAQQAWELAPATPCHAQWYTLHLQADESLWVTKEVINLQLNRFSNLFINVFNSISFYSLAEGIINSRQDFAMTL